MKTLPSRFSAIALATVLLLVSIQLLKADTFTVTTAAGSGADCSIRGSTTTNIGASTSLNVRSYSSSTGSGIYKAYLRFDLRNSGINLAQATSATLSFSSATSKVYSNVGFDFYSLADGVVGDGLTGWAENTLIYSNAPGNPVSKTDSTFITSTTGDSKGNYFVSLGQLTGQKSGAGVQYIFSSAALLNAIKGDSNGVITIGIRRVDTGSTVALASKENTNTSYLKPTLTIVAPRAPTVTTSAATIVSYTSATLNGTVNPNGGATTSQFNYSTSPTLASGVVTTTAQSLGSGTSAVAASATLTGLLPHTTYYFRDTASNSAGTTQGSILSFTTSNHSPVAVNDSLSAPAGSSAFTISALANDTDADSDTLSITSTTNGTYGTVSTDGTTLTYTPGASYQGNDSFTYTVSDGAGGTSTATVSLSRAPSVTTQAASSVSYTSATLNAVANPGGVSTTAQFSYSTSPTLASGVTTTSAQSLGSGTAAVPFTASPSGLAAHTTYYYRASATSSAGTSQDMILSFTTLNHAPVATNDSVAAPAGSSAFSISALANDTDGDGDILTITGATSGTYGTTSTNGTTITYTPGAGYQGNDSFAYTISDGVNTASATVTIYRAPTTTTQAATSVSYTTATLNATVNPGGVSATAQFSYSTSSSLSSGVVTTTAQALGSGTSAVATSVSLSSLQPHTTYYYRVSATNSGGTSQGSILNFTTSNHTPVAVADSIAAPAGSGAFTISVLANDSDADGDTLSISSVTNGLFGTVTNNHTSVTYVPGLLYLGNDSFTYTVSDGAGGTATATVTISSAPPVTTNTATNVSYTSATLNGSANPGGISANGQFTWSTSPSLSGGTTTASQSLGSGSSPVPMTAALTGLLPHTTYYFRASATNIVGTTQGGILSFTTGNHPPVAGNDSFAAAAGSAPFNLDVLANDSDADGDTLSFSATTNGTYGTVSTLGSTLTYTPGTNYQGNDSFTYSISDGAGGTATATVTLYRAPTVATLAASGVSYTTATLNATVNPSALATSGQFSYSTSPTLASGVVTTSTQSFGAGTSNAAATAALTGLLPHTSYYYRITATNSVGTSQGAILSFTTANHPPVAVNDTLAAPTGSSAFTISVLANDSDADSDTVTVSATTNGSYGTVSTNGTFLTYTPGGSYQGNDSFTYTISDGIATATATVTVFRSPSVTTQAASSVTYTGATLNTAINPGGISATGQFSYSISPTLASGVTTTTAQSLGSGTSSVAANAVITGLQPHTTYYFRATGINSGGTTQGSILNFATFNHTPVAANDSVPAPAGSGAFTINALSNDTDGDADTLTITSATNGTYGSVTNNTTSLQYTPGGSYQGNDSFTYTITDGFGGTSTATVTIFKAPVVSTQAASFVSYTSATINGRVNPGGVSTTAQFTYSTSPTFDFDVNTTTVQSLGSGTSNVNVNVPLTNLDPHTTYYFQVAATNTGGSAQGSILSFTTLNHPPVAVDDTFSSSATSTAFTLDVLANDSDEDGDFFNITGTTNGSFGTVSTDGDLITYTPGNRFQGNDTFTYTITDEFGDTDVATVTLNKAPTVTTQAATTVSYTSVTLNASVNPNGVATTAQFSYSTSATLAAGVTTTTAQSVGSGTSAAPVTASITGLLPHTTYYFRASASSSGGSSQDVILSFTTANHSPVASNDSVAAPAGSGVLTISALANDTDADSDTLTISATTNGTYGTTATNGSTITYTPGGSYQGNDSFSYTISDGFGGTASATVTLSRAPTASSAVATNVSYATATLNGSAIPGGLAATGVFVYGTSATLTSGTATTTSQSLGSGVSTLAYSAALTGLQPHTTYYYRAAATNTAGTGQGTILSFTTSNHTPVAVADAFGAPVGNSAFTLDVKANDTDADNDALSISAVTDGTYGTVSTNGSTVTYTPGSSYQGNDSFTYTVSDGFGGTATATVTLSRVSSVTTGAAFNVSYTSATLNGSANPGGVAATGVFVYGTSATLASSTTTTTSQSLGNGTSATAYSAALTGLLPHTTYYFRASVTNTAGGSLGTILSFATSNHSPVAVDDSFAAPSGSGAFTLDVKANDTDADNDTLSISAVTNGSYGTVVTNGSTVTYTPSGSYQGNDSFTYTVSDGFGGTATATITLNRAPSVASAAATDVSYTSVTLNGSANPGGVAATGAFIYGTSATLVAGTSTTLQALGSGTSTVSFSSVVTGLRPHTTYYFCSSASNGSGATQGAILSFATANHSPVAVDDVFSAPSGSGTFALNVKANDTDVDNDTLTISAVTNGTYGTVSTNGSTVNYTPGSNYQGNDSFTYTISDGFGGTATATASITRLPEVTTLAATDLQPGAAILNASVSTFGLATDLSFEVSTDDAFTSPTTSSAANIAGTPGVSSGSVSISGLTPNVRYYFRAIVTNSAGTSTGTAMSLLTPVIVWGNTGALPAAGAMDATVIPNTTTTPVVYTNINNQHYDVQVSTNNLARNEFTNVLGESSWWLEGSALGGSGPATVQIKFCATGTDTPQAVLGVRFRFEDAELYEAFSNFSYFDAAGTEIPLLWNGSVFSYSHTPVFNAAHTEVENGAPPESTIQNGKWIQVNLANVPVTGFKFGLRRKAVSAAGGVIMTSLGGTGSTMDITGNFTPNTLNTEASGTATLPDYTTQASITGNKAVSLVQTPAPGSMVSPGRVAVVLNATDADGNNAHTGFNVTVNDHTVPTIAPPAAGFTPLSLTSPAILPDYTSQAVTADNVGVAKVTQTPKAGTIANLGLVAITLTAADAAGNTASTTFSVTVLEDASNTSGVRYASVVATGGPVSGAGEAGNPVAKGAAFQTFGIPSEDDGGALAFNATYTEGALRKSGVFAGNPPRLVAAKGNAAPGITDAVFGSFYDPVLNRAGTTGYIAFQAVVAAAAKKPAIPATATNGIWTNVGGSLQLVVRMGTAAPGTGGALFKNISAITLVQDEVLFTAGLVLDGTLATAANDQGAWRWTAGAGLELILREGQTIPTIAGNKIVSTFQMIGSVASSTGHGRHHLAAGKFEARVTCTDKSVINYHIDATGDTVVFTPLGQTGQALIAGSTATTVGVPAGNGSGRSAFVETFAATKSKSITAANNSAIVSSRTGAWDCVACKGETACDSATWIGFSDPVINDNGDVAWVSGLSGSAAQNSAVGWGPLGSDPCVVARKGCAAAGTNGALFASFTSVALPNGGPGPVFTANLALNVGDTNAANSSGLWAVDCHDNLCLLLRRGQTIAGRTIRSFTVLTSVAGSPGQTHSFNNQRSILVSVTFTDNVQSLLTVTVP